MVVDIGSHPYSIDVTPAGGAEQIVGENFAIADPAIG
jgi:hypothetical protein